MSCTVSYRALQSPFPEYKGEEICKPRTEIETVHAPRKKTQDIHPPKSASATAEEGSAVNPSLLRPSEVRILERQMADTQRQMQGIDISYHVHQRLLIHVK